MKNTITTTAILAAALHTPTTALAQETREETQALIEAWRCIAHDPKDAWDAHNCALKYLEWDRRKEYIKNESSRLIAELIQTYPKNRKLQRLAPKPLDLLIVEYTKVAEDWYTQRDHSQLRQFILEKANELLKI